MGRTTTKDRAMRKAEQNAHDDVQLRNMRNETREERNASIEAEFAAREQKLVEMPTEGELLLAAEREQAVADAVAEVEAEHGADEAKRGKSVVPLGYKKTYATRAVLAGQTSKAAKRQNGDWLAQELLAECVPDGKTFDLTRFLAIFEANTGTDALARWPNRNSGWQGRLRMSGAIVLRSAVAKSGVFRTPDSEVRLAEIPEAAGFLARWDGRNH